MLPPPNYYNWDPTDPTPPQYKVGQRVVCLGGRWAYPDGEIPKGYGVITSHGPYDDEAWHVKLLSPAKFAETFAEDDDDPLVHVCWLRPDRRED